MADTDVTPLLNNLVAQISNLEATLAPLTGHAASSPATALLETTSKLPLLDRGKLYVTLTYAIDSIIFSYLKTRGTATKDHPIVTELQRAKLYIQKLKDAENPPAQRSNPLDKDAANRFIAHGLAGNDRYDAQRAELRDKERASAKQRLQALNEKGKSSDASGTHTKFEERRVVKPKEDEEMKDASTPTTDDGAAKKTKKRKKTAESANGEKKKKGKGAKKA
ncbi:hypothetical protein YB2330_005749 [Saitoella coloradoensis]